jgi:hypothetical protein
MNECVVAIQKMSIYEILEGQNFIKTANFVPSWLSDNALGQVQKFLIQCFSYIFITGA